jgi:hypothetical protein
MQANPYYVCKDILKFSFYLENIFLTGLEHCMEYLKILDFVRFDLKEFCKRFDSIQKTEKEKEKRRNKNRNGPGKPFGPVRGSSPQPRKKTESVP